jgi:hypothetical protein
VNHASAELRDRLSACLAEQYMRWLHPDSGPSISDKPFL